MRVKPEIVPVFKIQLYLTHESLNLVLESLNLNLVPTNAERWNIHACQYRGYCIIGKNKTADVRALCLDEVQILIFDDSAMEKPSQRPRSGLSPARVLPFANITTSFFRGTRVLHQKSHSHRQITQNYWSLVRSETGFVILSKLLYQYSQIRPPEFSKTKYFWVTTRAS